MLNAVQQFANAAGAALYVATLLLVGLLPKHAQQAHN